MVAHVAGGAVAVVGHGFDDDGDAARAVALVDNGLIRIALTGGSGLFEHALNVVVGHVGRLGLGDDGRQTRIVRRIGHAAALFDRDDHFLGNLGKRSCAFGVLCALGLLNVMPLGMSGHGVFFLPLKIC